MDKLPHYVEAVCKAGQGASCCRYLMMGSDGWECAKITSEMKSTIDAQAHRMMSKGDNCEGRPLEVLNTP